MKKFINRLLFVSLFFCGLSRVNAGEQDHWHGAEYYENSSSQKDAAADLLKFVPLKGNERVLDVGCGDGKISAAIASKLPNGSLLGVDISPSMIEFALQAFPEAGYANLKFALQDAQKLNYNGEFDLIFSFTTLQWIQDHSAFLTGAYNGLKAKGVLAVTMPMGLPDTLAQAVNEIIAQPNWTPYFDQFHTGWNFVTEQEYGKWLKAHNFAIQRLAVVPQKDIFPSREVFQKFISQWFPYLRPLPQDQKQLFMNAVIDRFLQLETPFPNGEVHFKIRRLEVVAYK